MMYHRIAMELPHSVKNKLAEQEACAVAQNLINQKEKHRCDENQDQCHDGCHDSFTPCGPNNFGNLGTHLLEKRERIRFRSQRLYLLENATVLQQPVFKQQLGAPNGEPLNAPC